MRVLAVKKDGTICVENMGTELKDFYSALECTCVTLQSFEVNNIKYDIWCDEEALCRGIPLYPTAFLGELKPYSYNVLFNNLVIAKTDKDGELAGLDDNDVKAATAFMKNSQEKIIKAQKMGLL